MTAALNHEAMKADDGTRSVTSDEDPDKYFLHIANEIRLSNARPFPVKKDGIKKILSKVPATSYGHAEAPTNCT